MKVTNQNDKPSYPKNPEEPGLIELLKYAAAIVAMYFVDRLHRWLKTHYPDGNIVSDYLAEAVTRGAQYYRDHLYTIIDNLTYFLERLQHLSPTPDAGALDKLLEILLQLDDLLRAVQANPLLIPHVLAYVVCFYFLYKVFFKKN